MVNLESGVMMVEMVLRWSEIDPCVRIERDPRMKIVRLANVFEVEEHKRLV
jgi:hypothetical protein